jgi:hypothetical protein
MIRVLFHALGCRLAISANTPFSRMAGVGIGVLMPKRFFGLRGWWSALVGVALLAVISFGNPAVSQAAWRLPKRQVPAPNPMGPAARAGSTQLQEVSPPAAVHQFKDALGEKLPQLKILEPANGAMVADGAWTLRVKVSDWPLIDGGSLGLGPHLLAILDGEPPRVLTATQTEMPPLSPGSHRLTVTAAWPWGEVIKSHGAFDQIRLHRAAVNPLAVPPLGSAQLFVTSPNSNSKSMAQPVLVDWLLIDAPLQNLRQDDASWRLRITVNGESFLVDQQTPLWLSGWRSGANALLWELVDGRGEPLNPPFNSIVSEMYLEDSKLSQPFNSLWLSGQINANDLAVLLGNASPVTPVTEVQEEPLPSKAIQPQNVTSLLQDKDKISNNNEIQFDESKVLLEPAADGGANAESPLDPGHGLEEAQPDSGPGPSAPAEPINPMADALTLGVPNLETPARDQLPDGPAKPEPPLAEAGSLGSKAERRERDRPATALPDTSPSKDIELEELKDVLPAAGEGGDLDPTMIPPPTGGFLARLGQGLRSRLVPS